jgi:hypothetical protein
MSAPEVDYLSVSLELTESAHGETTVLRVSPIFDRPQIELEIETFEDEEGDGPCLTLNRRQIECLCDFLVSWLARTPAAPAKAEA